MIRLSKHLYLHWLTVIMFVSAYITRTLGITCMMYSVMLLHELAHMAAAAYLKLGISRIILYPFGVSLTVKSRILCSLSDSMILYVAGPLVNAVIAAIGAVFNVYNLFMLNNLAVFVLNILPIIPLDGGRIAEALLIRNTGERNSRIIMSLISIFLSMVLIAILIVSGSVNINSVTFVLFVFGNCIMQKPKYNRDLIKVAENAHLLPRLCNHFHVSVQSGCDETLRRMRRRYTTEEFLNGINLLREAFPGAAVTTDIMVGFPGETEEEFAQSLEFAKKASFAKMHIFPYSIREGTRAAAMEGQLPMYVKKERVSLLEEIDKKNAV